MVQYERFDIGTQAVIYVHSDAGRKIREGDGVPVEDALFILPEQHTYEETDEYTDAQQNAENYAAIGESALKYSTVMVDVPSDKKASVLREYKEGSSYFEPAFMTKEEADSEMAQSRKEIRKTVLGESDEAEEEMSN